MPGGRRPPLINNVKDVGRYVLDWERLPDAAKRVAATSGIDITAAKIDLCRAISDHKIKIRGLVETVTGEPAEHVPGTVQQKGFSIPTDLNPYDFDWPSSRPLKSWRAHRPVYENEPVQWQFAWIEALRDDVSRQLCGAKKEEQEATPTVPEKAKRRGRRKSRPSRQLVRGVIKRIYPHGVPKRGVESNKVVCGRVKEKFEEEKLPTVSDSTILRAVGRK